MTRHNFPKPARAYYEETLDRFSHYHAANWIIFDLESFITKNWHPEEAKRLIACVKEKAEALALEREFEPNPEDLRTHSIRLKK